MSATVFGRGEKLALDRGSVAVCIPITSPERLSSCLHSVLEHTPETVPLVVVEGAGTDDGVRRLLSDIDRELSHVQVPGAPGPVGLTQAGLAACGEADVIVLADDAIVFDGWLERLCEAGRSDTTIATVIALSNSTGHCRWIARAAIELAGPLDEAFGSLASAVTDFSQRCLARGLQNLVAKDVLALWPQGDSSMEGGLPGPRADRTLLERRYPYLKAALREPVRPAPQVSLSPAHRAPGTASVTIDARIVRGPFSGTHAETLELIEALARTGRVTLRAILDPAISADALEVLDRAPSLERVYAPDLGDDIERTAVVHRPYQVTSVEDLELLARLGERIVITHLDLISYHNPSYFDSFESWRYHREVTRHALAMADRVIFLSEHAARDAIREQLIERDRTAVLAPAVNRAQANPEPRRPDGAPSVPFLLQIGNDFRHKNRVFSIRLLSELRGLGWPGELVLVGANVGPGSSRDEEAEYLSSRPELAKLVHDLPPVDEAQKTWLYSNTAAISYPSTYEGFGLIPFEAARAGKPCLFAPQASLAEVLPLEAAVLVPWDPRASAERVLPLLGDSDERRRQVELVSKAGEQMGDWTSLGEALLKLYDETAGSPLRQLAELPVPPTVKRGGQSPVTRLLAIARRGGKRARSG